MKFLAIEDNVAMLQTMFLDNVQYPCCIDEYHK